MPHAYKHVTESEFMSDLGERIVVITCIAEKRTECAKRIGGWVSCLAVATTSASRNPERGPVGLPTYR